MDVIDPKNPINIGQISLKDPRMYYLRDTRISYLKNMRMYSLINPMKYPFSQFKLRTLGPKNTLIIPIKIN